MKKKTTTRRLILSTETLRNLNDPELGDAAGGATGALICTHSQGQATRCTICPGCTI